MSKLYIITGPAGIGKTTISKKVAEILEKSVLIEGDNIYNFFVGGRIKPWLPDAPLELFWDNCIYLIKSYLEHGYDVVFNYIINPTQLNMLLNTFKGYEIKFKVLLADKDTIASRDKERPIDCQMGKRSLVLLQKFIEYDYDSKYIIDTTDLSVNDILNKIVLE